MMREREMSSKVPIPYRIFFLYLEPLSTLVGAFYAALLPRTYLYLTHATSAPPDATPFISTIETTLTFFQTLISTSTRDTPSSAYLPSTEASLVPLSTRISLLQLANLYVLFAINEALVLRSTSSRQVWRALLFGLLIADLGHLLSVAPLGSDVYWRVWEWNAMDAGNVGFVYLGAAMRIAFLCGLGLGGGEERGMAGWAVDEADKGSKKN